MRGRLMDVLFIFVVYILSFHFLVLFYFLEHLFHSLCPSGDYRLLLGLRITF